ncbi:hypothetical protein F5B22DRAFT_628439 [Xylaria bambusicola]|uniref:uncharacterized protein n=1 Tax=Xylaria bambusicola TaxID=326684 RepID=UPI0020084C74|nr:uncharacterized protein F5B22DRAFT_628439 [Xylaria bambusicola]KAI0505268.1 hypothetical protein F5B22DRAFT_628439 [Xylaria bambusicola]
MRSFALLAAPMLAGVALAQDDNLHTTVLTIGFTNSEGSAVTATTTYTYEYSNPVTTLLTQTNSDGIITGLPSNAETSQPAVVTSQPAVVTSIPDVATIPAGLPEGTTTILQGNSSSFVISVGPSTTVVLTSTSTTSSRASGTGGSDSTPTDGSNPSETSDSSDDNPTETPGAAAGVVPASFGLVSFIALAAALF